MTEPAALVVLTTFPDPTQAREAVQTLVTERLAACGTLLPGAESIYTWKGTIETAAETLVLLKTAAARWPELETRLRGLHPYGVPEIIALPSGRISAPYLAWLNDATGPARPPA